MNKKTAATKQMLQIIRLSSSSRTFRSTVAKEDENHSHFQLDIYTAPNFSQKLLWRKTYLGHRNHTKRQIDAESGSEHGQTVH